ncbi:Alkaline protease 1 [Colletotrichum trifolii]|uniref:Alkaline protease 1 n=1 Tax=Colletotrichum trifolii TaxID=5466 RepID=A0A4R8QWJ3_COLTR|nr:Alkaline protease 1 [Colletotrichum trifolii]
MVNFINFAAIIAAIAPFAAAAPARQAGSVPSVEGKFVVTLKSGITAREVDSHMKWVDNVHKRSLGRRDTAGVEREYSIGSFHGYSGHFDEGKMAPPPPVINVEPEQIYTLDGLTTQLDAPWGLASMSSRTAGSSVYMYDTTAGEGTYAYIIDSGINVDHEEFEGRVYQGHNAIGGDFEDTSGHGTHVAGIVGGKTYGVAKRAGIIDVKVFSGSSTTTSIILEGYQWAVNDIIYNRRQSRAVINMSLSGGASAAYNDAVAAAFEAGVLTVVAAGNNRAPASTRSPASAPQAITVGAVDAGWREAAYSNYGDVVDVLAPGSRIPSASFESNVAIATHSGTSMAAPHVAGLALYLAALENINDPVSLTARILELATAGATTFNEGTPSLVAFNGVVSGK